MLPSGWQGRRLRRTQRHASSRQKLLRQPKLDTVQCLCRANYAGPEVLQAPACHARPTASSLTGFEGSVKEPAPKPYTERAPWFWQGSSLQEPGFVVLMMVGAQPPSRYGVSRVNKYIYHIYHCHCHFCHYQYHITTLCCDRQRARCCKFTHLATALLAYRNIENFLSQNIVMKAAGEREAFQHRHDHA